MSSSKWWCFSCSIGPVLFLYSPAYEQSTKQVLAQYQGMSQPKATLMTKHLAWLLHVLQALHDAQAFKKELTE